MESIHTITDLDTLSRIMNRIFIGSPLVDSRDIAATVGIDVPMTRALLEVLVTEAQPPMFYQMLGTAAVSTT